MNMPVTQCLIKLHEAHHNLEDYQGGVPRWCSGCGDNAILAAVQRLCRDEDLAPERTVFVSGIGCSSRFPHYMKTYGFHGIHGRAFPIAEGVKMARPDLAVFVNTGDGDCCSIGAAHWIHAIRYNMNLTAILHDNHVYGLTKKQASPTSPRGLKSNTTPRGSTLEALNPLTVTLGVTNVSFVAQAVDWIPELLYDILRQAYLHRGFSFVRIIQRCPEFLPKMFEPWLHDPGKTLLVSHAERPRDLARAVAHLPQPDRARSVEHRPGARDRVVRGPDPGRDPVPQPRRALLRRPARRRPVAHRRADPRGARGRARQGHRLAGRRFARPPGGVRPAAQPIHDFQARRSAMDMAAGHHEQRVFVSTGTRHGEGVDAIDGLGLRPALLARYRDLTRLRYDFPLVLVDRGSGAGTLRSLSSVVDEVLQEIAPRGLDGERLRKHVLRLEREIRVLLAAGAGGRLTELWADAAPRLATPGDPSAEGVLTHIAEKLQLDGEVVDCDRAMPARVLAHVWKGAQARKAKAFRTTVDRLVIKLSDILRAAFIHSQAGQRPEALRASLGGTHRDVVRLRRDVAARRAQRPQGRAAGDPSPPHRGGARGPEGAALLSGSAPGRSPGRPGTVRLPLRQLRRRRGAYRERLPQLADVVKAISIAELEADGAYVEARHDAFFAHFDDRALSVDDIALFPDYLVCVPPDKADAPENAGMMDMLSAGLPVKVLIEATDLSRRPRWVPGTSRSACARCVSPTPRPRWAACSSCRRRARTCTHCASASRRPSRIAARASSTSTRAPARWASCRPT